MSSLLISTWDKALLFLYQEKDAEFREGCFTSCGRWMDGWETRRQRMEGNNWCIIQLGE